MIFFGRLTERSKLIINWLELRRIQSDFSHFPFAMSEQLNGEHSMKLITSYSKNVYPYPPENYTFYEKQNRKFKPIIEIRCRKLTELSILLNDIFKIVRMPK